MTGERLRRVAAAVTAAVTTPAGFHLLVTALMVWLCIVRVVLFEGTGGDDGEQIVLAQQWALGYVPRNPPLYTWLVLAAQHLAGVSVLAVALVKFALLWLLYVVLYRTALIVIADSRLAALAALSPLAMWFVAWDAVLGFSHSVLAITLCVATALILLELERRPGLPWALALGAVAGAGLLGKYGYGVFLIALLAAALLDAKLRAILVGWRGLAALAVMTAMVAPYAVWLAGQTGGGGTGAPPLGALPALWLGAKAAVSFLTPLWILVAALFPAAFLHRPANAAGDPRHRRLIGRQLLGALAVYAVVLAVSGLHARDYYMFVLILFPVWAFARIAAAERRPWAADVYGSLLAALALAAAVALPAKAVVEKHTCDDCELQLPYDAWAAGLRARGFGGGTIVADWYPYPLAGNFRVRFPHARVVDVKHLQTAPPPSPVPGDCVLVWTKPDRQAEVAGLVDGLGTAAAETIAVPAPGGGSFDLHVILVPDGGNTCR